MTNPNSPPRRSSMLRAIVGAAAALVLVGGAQLVGVGSASAAESPSEPIAAPFSAPLCAGTTLDDPAAAPAPVADLTMVFGARLDAYNAGSVVPLYDSLGGATASYPPLCGTRYDAATGGPVSEWMFCTDVTSKVCGDVNAAGELTETHGETTTVVNPLTQLTTNPKLTADQEKLVAYLVHQGHSYAGIGNQSWNGTTVAASGIGTWERTALQTLIWCVSDPAAPDATSDFAATCAANMDAAEQARLLTLIPDDPTVTLAFDDSGTVLAAGDVARFQLTTNLYNQPIALAVTATGAVDVAVCDGAATLSDGTIAVAGDDPTMETTVTLCATAAEAGTVRLDVTATPASVSHIGWNQSRDNPDGVVCQVFATFEQRNQLLRSSTASASFVTKPVTPEEPETPVTPEVPVTPVAPGPDQHAPQTQAVGKSSGTLPSLGADVPPLVIGGALALLFGGAIVLTVRRLRANAAD